MWQPGDNGTNNKRYILINLLIVWFEVLLIYWFISLLINSFICSVEISSRRQKDRQRQISINIVSLMERKVYCIGKKKRRLAGEKICQKLPPCFFLTPIKFSKKMINFLVILNLTPMTFYRFDKRKIAE